MEKMDANRIRGMGAFLAARIANPFLRIKPRGGRLPFNTDAPVRGYLHTAFPTGILTSRAPLDGPALNYHLQLFFPAAKLTAAGQRAHVRFLPSLEFHDYAALGYLTIKPWQAGELLPQGAARMAQALVDIIGSGGYVHAYINEFFMPAHGCFLRQHFRHSTLLVGYEPAARSFIHARYQRDGAFRLGKIPARVFIESLRLEKYGIQKKGSEVLLEAIRPAAELPPAVDPGLIQRQLRAYREGTDNADDYEADGPYAIGASRAVRLADQRGQYGRAVYDSFRRYFEGFGQKSWPLDLRATRTLLEHKQMVQRALQRASRDRRQLRLADEYGALIPLAKRLHLTALAMQLGAAPPAAGPPAGLLDELETTEHRILGDFLGAQDEVRPDQAPAPVIRVGPGR